MATALVPPVALTASETIASMFSKSVPDAVVTEAAAAAAADAALVPPTTLTCMAAAKAGAMPGLIACLATFEYALAAGMTEIAELQ